MNTFMYSYLVVMIIATIFLSYVHRTTIAKSFKALYKVLEELGKGAGHAMRHQGYNLSQNPH